MDPLEDAKHTACPQPRYQPYQMGRLFDLGPMCIHYTPIYSFFRKKICQYRDFRAQICLL